MQQVLFQISTKQTLPILGYNVPIFGVGLLLLVWVLLSAFWTWQHFRRNGMNSELQSQIAFQAALAVVIGNLPSITTHIKIFGYGFAMVCGFLCAAWLAIERAKREGLNPEIIWRVGSTVLFSGVIGARLFFIFKHPENFFGGGRDLGQTLFQIVNLPSGGLVLYGGVILGIGAFIVHCRMLGISALRLADILIPSIFVGEMFGRIGCFLNGCCYGAPTTLPWAVRFPPGSVPFEAEVATNIIQKTAQCTIPLHPTQIYSSILALILAIITWNYYPRRSRNGSVLLLGWILYPIARFGIEFIRDDTPGEFGTSLTIAQFVSMGMILAAIGFGAFLSMEPKLPESPKPAADGTPLRPIPSK